MVKNNDRWSALSMSERADLIKLYVSGGILDLNKIREDYNSFTPLEEEKSSSINQSLQESKVNKSSPSGSLEINSFGDGGPTREMTPSEAAALNKTLNNSQYMLAVGDSPDNPAYLSTDVLEPAAVKAFNSTEDYNRYQGEKFGEYVAEGMNNAAPHVLEAAMLPFTISGALEAPMLLYQGAKVLPQAVKLGKSAFRKGKKYFGKKVLGMVDDMENYINTDSHFRIVDRPAIDDAINTGTIRAKTGLYHGTPEYLKANFSKYLDDIPGWEQMDAVELRKLLESNGAFSNLDDVAKAEAKLKIRNSTNRGGTVHYFKGRTYPNYRVKPSHFVIETPHNQDIFVAGHGGREYGYPLGEWGASLLKTDGSVKGASIPTAGSSYWEYSPFWEMWKRTKFEDGGRILSGEESTESTLSGESIDDTGILDRIKGWFTKSVDSTEEVIDDFEDPTYLTYKGAPNVLRMYLTQNRYGKYNTKSKGVYGDTHYDAVESRYFNITQSMKDKGFSKEEINRLAPFLVTQMILEGGYRVNAPGNNFGGMLDPKTREKLEFDTDKEFYSAYLDNLDKRWGDEYLGEGNGWRNSKTLKEYADIINREDLNLYSEEKFNEYNRTHPENPAYLYTPVWENNGTGLMSDAKFGGIQDRVNGLIELIKLRQSEFRDLSRSNGWLKSMSLEDIMKMQEEKLSQGGK